MIIKTRNLISFITRVSNDLMKYSGLEETWWFMMLGFILTALSPFWIALSLVEIVFSVVVPIIGLILMVFLGLPLLNIIKWLQDTYCVIYSVLMIVMDYFGSFCRSFGRQEASQKKWNVGDGLERKWSIYKGERSICSEGLENDL